MNKNSQESVELNENFEVENVKVKVTKDQWGNEIEFLLSCITLSVGLGNVWRFPFTALENGGGSFVIPYTLIVILVGKPLYYLELLLGQFSSKGCIKVYDICPAVRGVGVGQCLCTIIVLSIYASVMALTIRFFLLSFNDPLPWSFCHESWNASCVDSSVKFLNFTTERPKSSAEIFFIQEVLKESDTIENGIGLPDLKLTLCLIFAWTVIGCVLVKGIQSSGKAAYFLAVFPYIVLILLLIRSSTLEGAIDGMIYFIRPPSLNELFNAKIWYAAVTQVFYALGVCFGSIIMYSSYNKFNHNVTRDCHIITTMDYLTSILAGLIIFGILGHLAHVMRVDIKDVTKTYMGLAFIAYPEAIAKFDFMPQFFSVIFFFMLFLFCIGSNMGMASCIMTVIRDVYPNIKCWKIVIVMMAFGISIGCLYTTPGGQFLINFLDFYGASFVALLLAIVEVVTVGWFYGIDRFCKDVEFMLGTKTGIYFKICWKFITPGIMISIFGYFVYTWKPIDYKNLDYSTSMHTLGWIISIFALGQIPFWALVAFLKRKDSTTTKKLMKIFQPNANWGPVDDEIRMEYNRNFAY